jgi:site-specific recombinase XerD
VLPTTLTAIEPRPVQSDQDLIEVWIAAQTSKHTQTAYRADSRRLLCYTSPLSEITLPTLIAFRSYLATLGTSPNTQKRVLVAVKSLLSFGHLTGYLRFNVGTALRVTTPRNGLSERILDETDIALLINAVEGRNQVMLRLLYSSGVRVSELVALKWVDALARGEDGGQITVFGKGNRTRTILLKPKTWQRLESLRKDTAKPFDAIFESKKGGHLDVSMVRRIVREAAKKAGITEGVSPHWMRHAHASHALDRGAPIHLVQATLGHASISTTGKYLHARPVDSSSFFLPD